MLKIFRKMGIRMKLLLSNTVTLLVAFALTGFIILSSSISALNNVSYKQAQAEADALVARLRVDLEKPIATSKTLAESFARMVRTNSTTRNLIDEMLYSVFAGSPDIYAGIFTLWEPNAFDGFDEQYADAHGTDSTGRVMTWYYNAGAGVSKMKSYDSGTTVEYPDFYEETKSSMTNVCSEPYVTLVGGIQTRCIAVTCPVIFNGEFLGLVGYEVNTESLQETLESLALEGMDGQWISAGGAYVASADADELMQTASLSQAYGSAMYTGNAYEEKADGMYRVYKPYTLTGINLPWSISMSVPLTSVEASKLLTQGLIVLTAAFILILAANWLLAGSIVKPIKKLVGHADSMANGDMDFSIDIKSEDETRQLADAFENVRQSIRRMVWDIGKTADDIIAGNLLERAEVSEYNGDYGEIMAGLNRIMDAISELVKGIKDSAANVAAASQQLSDGSQALAQGSTEQAASVEEINATVSEVVQLTRVNSENAATARQISEKVHEEAEAGSDKMNRLLQALEEINIASTNISNIIKTIEDIAFQTNILALNASVEAARAGAHGKGFAVVAEEVKNLATKSADAANHTNELISASVVKAKGGVGIGEDMQRSLAVMVEGINSAVEAIARIAEESKRQVETIEQLNSGIEQISQVVQKNTATAEESASSSEEMSAQAERLSDMIARYKVN